MIKVENYVIDQTQKYPDGTPILKLNTGFLATTTNVNIVWAFDSLEEYFTIACLVEHLTNIKHHTVSLTLPYIPNARMDRVKYEDECFTLKTFANLINALNFTQVFVCNAHSDVSLALIDRVTDIGIKLMHEFLSDHKHMYDTIMFPDAGAAKRYGTSFNDIKDFGVIVGNKTRDWRTGKILGLTLDGDTKDIVGKNVMIVDDICSRGGTFKYAAIELKKRGANIINLYVTHCENVIDVKTLKESGINEVYTTDSIFRMDKATYEQKEMLNVDEIWRDEE